MIKMIKTIKMEIIEKIRKSKYSWIIGCLAILLIAYVVYVLTGDAVAGLTLAMPAAVGVPASGVITTQKTQELASEIGGDIVMSDTERQVTLLRPDIAPLDTMLRSIGSSPTDSFEVVWGEAGFGEGYVQTGTITPVNTGGGTATVNLDVDTYKLVTRTSMFYFEDAVAGRWVGLNVLDKDNATRNVICNVIGGTGSTPDELGNPIPLGTKLFFSGTAQEELAGKTEPYQRMPEIYSNYCQIQMCQIEQGLYDQKQKKELDWGLLEFKSDALYNFRYGCENTALFGIKSKSQNLEGKDIYTAGGLETYVGWHLKYNPALAAGSGGIDMGMFFGLGEAVFTTVAGSDSRIFFMSPQLMTAFLKNIEFQKMMSEAKTEVVYGLKCRQIETGFGLLNIRLHKGLGLCRPGQGAVVDLSRARMRVFEAMKWREIDLISSGISKAEAWALEERTTFEYRAKASHAWIYPVPSGATGVVEL